MKRLKKLEHFTVLSVSILLLGWSSGAFAAGSVISAIQDGADHILTIQNTDGSFTWPHGPSTSEPGHANITGPIGIGLVKAYGETGDADHHTGASNAAGFLVLKTSDWVGTFNPSFLLSAYESTGNTVYRDKATEFFTELTNGAYTRKSIDYNTTGYISLIQSARGGSVWSNLLPWEFATLAYAAQQVGTSSQASAFLQAVKDGIEVLNSTTPFSFYYDILGLSGGVLGLGLTGTDFDPTIGSFASANSTGELADILAGLQNSNGSWYWHSNLISPDSSDEDSQTTAYAMIALGSVNTQGQYNDEINKGRNYLVGLQLGSGGFPSYPGGAENIEVEGEAVWALTVPQVITLDINPKHCPNKLKVKRKRKHDDGSSDDKGSGGKKGNFKVAILGTQNFDVRTIDVSTVSINGVAPVKSKFRDVTAIAFKIYPCDCEKLAPDSFEDLELKFNRQDIVDTLGSVQDGEIIQLTLTGNLLESDGGTAIEGTDCVVIKIKGKDGNSSDDDSSGHKKK